MSHPPPPDGYPSSVPPNPPPTNPMNQTSNPAPSAPPPFFNSGSQASFSGHPQQQPPPQPPNAPPSAQYGPPQQYGQQPPPPPPDGGYAHQYPPGPYAQAPYQYQQQPPPPHQYGGYPPMQYMQQPQYAPQYAPPGGYPAAPPQAPGGGQRQQYYGAPAPYAPPGYPAPPPTGSPPQMAAAAPPGSYGIPPSAAGSSMMLPGAAGGEIAVDENGLPVIAGDIRLVGPSKFKVEEKVLGGGGDSFYVKDSKNVERYTVDGSMTVVGHKILKNSTGRTLLQMREARLSRKTRITITDSKGQALLTLQKHAVMGGVKRVDGYIGGTPEGVPVVVISGNRKNTDFTVVDARDRLIANVTRKTATLKNMFTGQDSYDVTVQLGSPALLCFMVVAIDEFYAD